MAHFAFVAPADAGHLFAMAPVAAALVRRGHRVTLVAPKRAQALVGKLGLALHELAIDDVPTPWAPLTFVLASLVGQAWLLPWFLRFAEALPRLLPAALAELAVDGAVIDQVLPAGGSAAERAGVPFVTFCSAMPWNREPDIPPGFTGWGYDGGKAARLRNRLGYAGWDFFFRPVLRVINRHRAGWGMAPFPDVAASFSPLLQLSQFCPGLDFPRLELPEVFHYVGSYAPAGRPEPAAAFPWDRLDGRPLVYASLGTIPSPANLAVFRRILEASAGSGVQLVLALGRWTDEAGSVRDRLGPVPAEALVVEFAPQLELLERASLMISHGGANSVLEALGRGVPVVSLPRSSDQMATAARVERAGAGLTLSFGRSGAAELRAAVRRTLDEARFRERAGALAKALREAGGPDRAAELIETALLTRRPVLRVPHPGG